MKLAKEFGNTLVGEVFNEGDIQSTGGFNNQAPFGGIRSVNENGDIVNGCVHGITVLGFDLQMKLTLTNRVQTGQLGRNPKNSSELVDFEEMAWISLADMIG